jgi:hypothetical protein
MRQGISIRIDKFNNTDKNYILNLLNNNYRNIVLILLRFFTLETGPVL